MSRDSSTLTAAVQKAATALAVDPASAERQALQVLSLAPHDPRALLVAGSARRRLGDPVGARAILEPLAKAYPRAANTQYELGATLLDLDQRASAKAALRLATSLNRDLAEAWRALGDLLFLDGDPAGAEQAFAEHERALVQDPKLKPPADALFEGDLKRAENLLRAHLTVRFDHPPALKMMAEVYARLGRHGDAETLLAHCLARDPDADGARFAYANALFQQQKGPEALWHAELLLTKLSGDPAYLNLKAACLGLVGRSEEAVEIYTTLLETYDKQPKLWLNQGHALRTVGRQQEAVAAYRRCIALAPSLGDAYWSLANLKVATFSLADEAEMTAQATRPDLSADDRLHLHYALGKALEDRKAFAPSFEHYAAGAQIRRSQSAYAADETTTFTERCKQLFKKDFFAERSTVGSPSDAPIFIVGLPRAGSTLVEQILASHSQVEGTMELPDINLIARGLGPLEQWAQAPLYPEVLASLPMDAFAKLGDRFLAETQIHRKLGRPFFIDKMPNNFQHVGLIHLILPGAKIIDARRHPLASGFSAFKQHFNQGQSFSYDLADIGRYYRDYVDLMGHFDVVLPGRVHRVIYEDMVDHTEREIRRLLAYCGLPFEAGCLKFYDNGRAVRTVSSEQVRRPIFRDGLEQWRNYQPWLKPLEAALGQALHIWRGAPSSESAYEA